MIENKDKKGEQGDIMICGIAATCALLLFFAIVIDIAAAGGMWAAQQDALTTAREECMKASFALQIKNSETPGHDTATHITEALRRDGVTGEVSVWFFELPPNTPRLPQSKRLIGVGIQIAGSCDALFARGVGITSFPITTHTLLAITPYSETRAWRPDRVDSGKYVCAKGDLATSLSYTALTDISQYPSELVDYISTCLQNLKER